mmetsp:Transcript_38287/g.113821  ORF Transcript_38287/g.113821 Transcript_38287/m.113821 type:complete len:231 (-) Transcript_38287:531-1223(-)
MRCCTAALTLTCVRQSRFHRCRSFSVASRESFGPRAAACPLACSASPSACCSRSTSACSRAFASRSSSILPSASLFIASKLWCVSSWVVNFWITSFTSATPVASLIWENAASYAAILWRSSSMSFRVVSALARADSVPLFPGASSRPARRSFSLLSSSSTFCCFDCSTLRRCCSSPSRDLRSSAMIASNLESSCFAACLDMCASCESSKSCSYSLSFCASFSSMVCSSAG